MSTLVILCSSQQKTIINAMAVNEDGVLATGGMSFLHFGYASIVVPEIVARRYSPLYFFLQ